MYTEFNREQFEAQARAVAPPMPEDMSAPDEALMDRDWFFYSVLVLALVAVTVIPWVLS